jgi:hypothetical protein
VSPQLQIRRTTLEDIANGREWRLDVDHADEGSRFRAPASEDSIGKKSSRGPQSVQAVNSQGVSQRQASNATSLKTVPRRSAYRPGFRDQTQRIQTRISGQGLITGTVS